MVRFKSVINCKLPGILLTMMILIIYSEALGEDKTKELNKKIPVTWHSGYIMPNFIEEKSPAVSISDLKKLAEKKWYGEFSVYKERHPDTLFSISTCKQLEQFNEDHLYTKPEMDNTPFMSIKVMCKATELIIQAEPSRKTYLNNLTFDKNLPNILPKQIAMIVSISESKRIENNPEIKYWSQVEKVNEVTIKSKHHAVYRGDGALQDIELVARGDFNRDGIEDMMITSREVVVGGSYSAIRLFLLTKLTENGTIGLIEVDDL